MSLPSCAGGQAQRQPPPAETERWRKARDPTLHPSRSGVIASVWCRHGEEELGE